MDGPFQHYSTDPSFGYYPSGPWIQTQSNSKEYYPTDASVGAFYGGGSSNTQETASVPQLMDLSSSKAGALPSRARFE